MFRLITKSRYLELADFDQPASQRSDMTYVALFLRASYIKQYKTFPFLHPPDYRLLARSLDYLVGAGAMTPEGNLTDLGS